MTPRTKIAWAAALCTAALSSSASAEALRDRFSAGGYFRIMTRPDFQGGAAQLGYWNLYGRLLNEGPWGALELKLDIVQNNPGKNDAWAAVFAKIEGGSFANTDMGKGNLGNFANTQLYVKAGNILLEGVTWQVGTLYTYPGDLGLYDMRPADLFWDTVGLSATWDSEYVQLILGVGDAGFSTRGTSYSTILTGGGFLKFHINHFELGAGGQYRYEPQVAGNKNAPYATTFDGAVIPYADYARHEVVKHWLEENPGQALNFPKPEARSSQSWKAVGYLGFGGFGPLRWDSFYVNFQRLHPDNFYKEAVNGQEYTVYVHDLTDDRYQWLLGNEMQIGVIPDRLDVVWGVVYGKAFNNDKKAADGTALKIPGDDSRTFVSTVLRLQAYLTKTVHFLAESSVAQEKSDLGNAYRSHADSVFETISADGKLVEYGDSDTRTTWQLKVGPVLNPTGIGIFTRPSLRILYGLQYSSQQAAYGNSFVQSLDQYNDFPTSSESHWHHVLAIEAEAWF
ncbi:MAG TPA: carbohydrate porin [Myxococcales bacterium]|jgi:hypothetical protein